MPRLGRRFLALSAGLSLIATAAVLSLTDAENYERFHQQAQDAYRLTSVNIDDSTLTLAWSGEAPKYRVRIGADLKKPLLDTTTTDPVASVEDIKQQVSRSGTLRYQIDTLEKSEQKQVLSGTLTLPPEKIAKQPDLKRSPKSVELTWKPLQEVSHYDISLSEDPESEPILTYRIAGDSARFVTDTLEPDTTGFLRVRGVRNGVLGEYSKPVELKSFSEYGSFKIGSWNICSSSCKGFGTRSGLQAQKVNESAIDIMAIQEGGGKTVARTTHAKFSGGERGFVRANGGADSRYIFYRESQFKQLAGSNFHIGNGRLATWSRFENLATGQRFVMVNAHLSPGKSKAKNRIRGQEARRLFSIIPQINSADEPVILVGDLNTGRHRRGDQVMSQVDRAGFKNSLSKADETEGASMNTFNRNRATPRRSGSHVDYILVSSGTDVSRWQQYNHLHNGRVLTDHNMLAATMSLTTEAADLGEATPATLLPVSTSRNGTRLALKP